MNITIRIEEWLECAHSIPELPQGHKCARLHGHSYRVEVHLSAKSLTVETGMVLDFGVVKDWLRRMDHQNLNDFFRPSSAENMAKFIWDGIDLDILKPLNMGSASINDHVRITRVVVQEGGKPGSGTVTMP